MQWKIIRSAHSVVEIHFLCLTRPLFYPRNTFKFSGLSFFLYSASCFRQGWDKGKGVILSEKSNLLSLNWENFVFTDVHFCISPWWTSNLDTSLYSAVGFSKRSKFVRETFFLAQSFQKNLVLFIYFAVSKYS